MKRVFVIMVEFLYNGKVDCANVSGEGYSTLKKAQEFLVKERSCKLYENFEHFPYVENPDGWCGIPTDDNQHRYYIREVIIK